MLVPPVATVCLALRGLRKRGENDSPREVPKRALAVKRDKRQVNHRVILAQEERDSATACDLEREINGVDEGKD